MVKRGEVRRINVVTVFLALFLATAVYFGYKFIPPYWNARKVDRALEATLFEASRIDIYEGDARADKLLTELRDAVIDLDVDERYIDVYFGEQMDTIHADYTVFVELLGGKSVELNFERSVDVPPAPHEKD